MRNAKWKLVLLGAEVRYYRGISRLEDATLTRIMLSYRDGFTTEEYEYTAKAGVVKVTMPAYGAMVLYHKCRNPIIFRNN